MNRLPQYSHVRVVTLRGIGANPFDVAPGVCLAPPGFTVCPRQFYHLESLHRPAKGCGSAEAGVPSPNSASSFRRWRVVLGNRQHQSRTSCGVIGGGVSGMGVLSCPRYPDSSIVSGHHAESPIVIIVDWRFLTSHSSGDGCQNAAQKRPGSLPNWQEHSRHTGARQRRFTVYGRGKRALGWRWLEGVGGCVAIMMIDRLAVFMACGRGN